jgi:hypothetical protein
MDTFGRGRRVPVPSRQRQFQLWASDDETGPFLALDM